MRNSAYEILAVKKKKKEGEIFYFGGGINQTNPGKMGPASGIEERERDFV